ncbi:NADP-dependent oxidoreductase [Tumebacillus sp. ITR2]|uniref:NADP-dependent oxidoreductase n=1 Tax=Tumebacillus amylolyticus TaxID=2801339 RepID=A0ABS1JBB6_9BACL|nr:NADP-dependent oxidoreductase [Tumebacillus amylolyticus]MBL0387577.1 NADP-dependent oxidoreductase [Tumebacillus amylolyticus]
MTNRKNRQFLLTSRPVGMPADENFELREVTLPDLEDGQVLVRTLYLSVDPYMRGRMSDAKSYVEPYPLGEVLQGGVVGEIVESKNERWQPGDVVVGLLGWQDFSVSNGRGLLKIDPSVAPISTALGVVGMPGLTAYFGLLEIGQPQEGETVVVSGAAGAVGTIVGQIAKIKGCRVVGIAGDDEKCAYLTHELGFDVAINYKTTADMRAALKEACPNGVDVYFDNVGGEITDAVMSRINFQARIAICGQISQYNLEKPDLGPRVFTQLLKSSALAKGFIVNDYAKQHKEGMQQLGQWVMEGKIKYRENIVDGLENVVEAFLGLFRGDNIGKQLVKVADL